MLASLHVPSSATIELSLACDIEQVRPVAHAAREFLATKNLSEEELMACELALVEACNNAVLYALPSRLLDPIEIDLSCDDSVIEINIHDHTTGFELPPIAELSSPESESGRGVFIIQSLMDYVSYATGSGENTLVLRKFRARGQAKGETIPVAKFNELKNKLAESELIVNEMAEELSSCYESLSAIFRSGAELGKTNNLQNFSRSLCEDLLQITSADWFLLRIVPKGETTLSVLAVSSPEVRLNSLSTAAAGTKVSAELKAAFYRKDVTFTAETPLDPNDSLQAMPPAQVGFVHPFYFAETLIGVLTLGKTSRAQPFTAAQVNVVHTFADFLAIQIINARLHEEQINHRLVTHELEIAQGIQRALLPKKLPRLCGFGLAGYCESARHVGGDFYDVVLINDHSALLIIADVMGKGVPAAMFAAMLRSILRGAPELANQPAALLSRVNRLLFEELSNVDMFITAQLAFVDVQTRELVIASAGHCPALIVCGKTTEAVSPEGMPLGILQETLFTELRKTLPQNSHVLLYTDGLPEARNLAGQFFGQERLAKWFCESAASVNTAERLKDSLVAELSDFQQHAAPGDDQTFLILAEENF
ncbi:MAG: SpoIIE family protein phosphatase [Verrucomicrobiota bacterium]